MEKIISAKDGSPIFYRTIGQGEPLFFIHGNSGSHQYFKRQIDYFKDHYQLILMDTRDHGLSKNKTDKLTFEQIMADIKMILKNEKIKKTAFFGFSDGANIALTFATYNQEFVSKLILVSPNITFNQLIPYQRFMSNNLYWMAKNILRSPKKSRVFQLARKDLPILPEQTRALRIPSLFIMGDHDIVTPDKMRSFVRNLPNATLKVIKNCGHSVPRLKPTQINQLSLNFLSKNVAQA
ncbi:alpha/beta fold hydrolase [Vagococcus hydrophili]|uniref:Alpha/beta hydrolase n=1 Tax=Vagococcus hydrophili TaxID=2714947 RepID=A0A6G8AQ22_9ENTE|nr:alpha/beta hydrolase [Vagococcus hydrophili]QIL47087.1 alpha/beta hydrolase [Vagococcus hydrophili]